MFKNARSLSFYNITSTSFALDECRNPPPCCLHSVAANALRSVSAQRLWSGSSETYLSRQWWSLSELGIYQLLCSRTCPTLCPSGAELLIERTQHTHTQAYWLYPLNCCSELFVCVGSCIYIRGLFQPPHSPPPTPYSSKKQKGQKLLSY